MIREFTSSVTRGGSAITPEKITVTKTEVIWEKRNDYLVGKKTITIPIIEISGINIKSHVLGVDISISSTGLSKIEATNFTSSDADDINSLLNSTKSELSNQKNSVTANIKSEPRTKSKIEQEAEMYTRVNLIPLITFGNTQNEIVAQMERLVSYAEIEMAKEKGYSKSYYQAYAAKLSEGLNYLSSLNADTTNRIKYEKVVEKLHAKTNSEITDAKKSEKNAIGCSLIGLIIMVIVSVFILHYLIAFCKTLIHSH